MGLAELVDRGRREASKRLERLGLSPMPPPDLNEDAGTLLERFREAGRGRFFEGAVSERTPTVLAARMPEEYEQTVSMAEAVCQRRFDLLGYRGLSFGSPVDWHFDPVSGRRAPRVHWSRLNPLDPVVVGDSKVVWELNRHQWLVHLGRAYRLTKDERYAAMFATCVQEWMRANPPGLGINWASSLEVSLRLIAWCWALHVFSDSPAASPELFICMLRGIRAHAVHVERYLSCYFSPNTHLTGEALGLFYAGVLFPEFGAAERWRALGSRILVEQSERQVLPDGVYFEQSTHYQRYTVETYLHFLILAERNGIAIPRAVGERVHQMLDFFLAIKRPDGSFPQIGDADGGWLLPLAIRAPDDCRGVFSTAAALFGRSDYAWAAGGVAPETLWLLGPQGVEAVEALRPAPPTAAPSRLFPDGGYAVMRSGWDAGAHQLVFDVGPLGCPVSAGHGHADLLSIQCSVFGRTFLADAGTYCYAGDPSWRDYFRSTAAHSTVLVDGAGQAIPAGPFRWRARPRARLRNWLSSAAFDFADASHDAYCRLPDPVVHRRRVLFVKPRYWVVVDDLEGATEHLVEIQFQFGPFEVRVNPELWAVVRGPKDDGLFLRSFARVPLKGEVHEGEVAPMRGWLSPEYGQRRPAPMLIYSAVARFPLRIVTLLLPTENPSDSPPLVTPIDADGPTPVGLVFEKTQETVRFDEHTFVVEQR
jgi:hypothetical protein